MSVVTQIIRYFHKIHKCDHLNTEVITLMPKSVWEIVNALDKQVQREKLSSDILFFIFIKIM